jgi:transposase
MSGKGPGCVKTRDSVTEDLGRIAARHRAGNVQMNRFVQCEERTQDTFLPSRLEEYVTDDNPVRVIDVFVGELDLTKLGFEGMSPQATGRPGYHPSTLLKIYLYGYLNRIQSSRRLERETQRNIELMWLTGRLMPDFKTIANFRKDNGPAIRGVCQQFIVLCRQRRPRRASRRS